MPEEFLAEGNIAGQTLLKLVSRGNAIIAEILRLSDFVPEEFTLSTKDIQKKYGEIILDFSYFKAAEFCDQRIENNPDLLERDEDFRENHLGILNRFYLLFESIFKYVKDLTRYLEDLDQGVFIQQTLESVYGTFDGKQLLIEALYLYGVMLLVLDQRIDGLIRERMLVSYTRYKSASATSTNLDDVCKLVRSTGFSLAAGRKPNDYPEEYFKRFPLPKQYISMAIGRLRSDDIYNQITSYPNPDHRSTALATQASMLYVILYFSPDLLQNDQAKMREIVDKHFPDNWVISYYMGFVVDLAQAWDGYKAAKNALNNTLAIPNVQSIFQRNLESLDSVTKELESFLVEGVLIESFVLDRIPKLMNCLRDANVTLRWLMLHTNTRVKKLKDMCPPSYSDLKLVSLLLNVSQFEFLLKNMFNELLKAKPKNWEEYKKEAISRMVELAEFFSGEKALTRVTKNETLQAWFNEIAGQISSLDFNESTTAGRKIVQLMQALDEVQEFHQLESNLQVRAFLADTKGFLIQMLRNVNVKEEILITIQLVADLSFGWELIVKYIPIMQQLIKRNPTTVIKLRATFLKLASILDLPLVRISQANSKDVVSVAEYYSGQLVEFVRRVLQIIPKSMFEILNQIVDIQTNLLKKVLNNIGEIPTRLEDDPTRLEEVSTQLKKEKLKDFADLLEGFDLARQTHAISVYTEGILAMENTLVGVIQVDPKQLLEDGIRRELVLQAAFAMDQILVFNKGKTGDLEAILGQLAMKLDGFRRSFEYIQDYVNIYAIKIWQEELSRIINFNVERECNSFLKTKVLTWDSQYQSVAIPIPTPPPLDDQSVSFVGRLAREILSMTDVRKTVFVHQMSAWYDRKTTKEIVGLKTFSQLFRSIGTFGLSGLDKLYSFMIVRTLQKFTEDYRKILKADKTLKPYFLQVHSDLEPVGSIPPNHVKLYNGAIAKLGNLSKTFTDYIVFVGHLQLLRRMIGNELNFRSKLDSKNLAGTLQVLNESLITDVKNHYRDNEAHPYPKDDNPLLFELSTFLEASGISDPFLKIYITTVPLEFFPLITFFYVISQIAKFSYDKGTSTFLYKGKNEPLDGAPFVVGIITLLKQFHSSHTQTFLAYLGQYVRTLINSSALKEPRPKEFPLEVSSTLSLIEEICKYSKIPRKHIEKYIPAFLFNQFNQFERR